MRWWRASGTRFVLDDARQNDRRAVRELGDKRQIPAHRFYRLPQRGQQQIAALLKPRDAVPGDSKPPRQAYLRERASLAKLA